MCNENDKQMCDGDNLHDDEGNDTALQPIISMVQRENCFSVTNDILDMMFLVFVDVCQRHHGVIPIDRGQHGLQFRFPYISPNEKEHYGTLSFNFYPYTSRLLVQGSSYMLWVEEHLPIVYKAVEGKYLADIPTWCAQSLRRGIGMRRNRRDGRHVSSNMTEAEAVAPQRFITCLVLPSAFSDRHSSDKISSPSIPLTDNDDGIRGDPTIVDSSDLVTSPPAPLANNDGNSGVPAISHHSPQQDSDDLPGPEPELDAVSDTTRLGSELETLLPPPSVIPVSPNCASNREHTASQTETSKQYVSDKATDKNSAKPKKPSNRKNNNKSQSNDNTQKSQCKSDCRASGKRSKDIIRCSLCMCWYHNYCVGEDSKYVGVWTCDNCCNIPTAIVNMQAQITDLVRALEMSTNTDYSQKDEIGRLQSENDRLRQKVLNIEKNNKELTKLIDNEGRFPASVSDVIGQR